MLNLVQVLEFVVHCELKKRDLLLFQLWELVDGVLDISSAITHFAGTVKYRDLLDTSVVEALEAQGPGFGVCCGVLAMDVHTVDRDVPGAEIKPEAEHICRRHGVVCAGW